MTDTSTANADLAGFQELQPLFTLTTVYEKAPDDPNEPTRKWFEEVVAFLRERL